MSWFKKPAPVIEPLSEETLEREKEREVYRAEQRTKAAKFKDGTQVVLKSGGPWMTINGSYNDRGTLWLRTVWFAQGSTDVKNGTFNVDTLEVRNVG